MAPAGPGQHPGMPIVYDAATRTFFLQAGGATYVCVVHPSGLLRHLHWGAPVRPQDLALIRPDDRRPYTAVSADGTHSPETIALEYPVYGHGDFRFPAVAVRQDDGHQLLEPVYASHRILAGKPRLAGLPATYCESEAEADTLVIVLRDAPSGIEIELSYTAFRDHPAIARSTRIVNRGPAAVTVERAHSAVFDLPGSEHELLHLSGAWASERSLHRTRLRPGGQGVESRRGASGHHHNPFIALLSPGCDEERGEAMGFSLVYSGNFAAEVEVTAFGSARVGLGINPHEFAWRLEPGEAFQAPEAVLVWSDEGLGGMSRAYHRLYRTRLVRGRWRDAERPILINNWEATYFDFTAERLDGIAARAAAIGVELFVLDDGWFGRRNDDRSSLGDWVVDRAKLPAGLDDLARRIAARGMRFGLWFEPEMVSPDSDLYRRHPDWCLHVPGRVRTQARQQLVLDFSRPEVVAHIGDALAAVLRSAPIAYVKWDMNRTLTEIGSAALPPGRQRETAHRHILGVYALMERLIGEFPDILFEGCAGGGGRFDPGILHYQPQYWTSDNSDAVSRLKIQYGTSIVYPLSTMGAHVSAVPNHQIHRTTPLRFRGDVAASGNFGYELDLAACSDADLDEMRRQIAFVKRTRALIAGGDLYRLASPFVGNLTAWMVVAPDRRRAVLFAFRSLAEPNPPLPRLRLRGLDPALDYRLDGGPTVAGGDALMAAGLDLWFAPGDFTSIVRELTAEPPA